MAVFEEDQVEKLGRKISRLESAVFMVYYR